MSVAKFVGPKGSRIGHSIVYPEPIALPPAPYVGAMVYGESGRTWHSNGTEWISSVDEARVAEIATDIASSVYRVLDEDVSITVDPTLGSDTEGVSYSTLGAALEYASNFTPAHVGGASPYKITINIANTGPLSEQIIIDGVNLAHVLITATAATVEVAMAGLTRLSSSPQSEHAFFWGLNGAAMPTLAGFRFIPGAGTPPQDADAIAAGVVSEAYTPVPAGFDFGDGVSYRITGRENVSGIANRSAGFTGAWARCVARRGSAGLIEQSRMEGDTALTINGSANLIDNIVRGETESLRCGGDVRIVTIAGTMEDNGAVSSDYRRTAGVDSPADLLVLNGGKLIVDGSTIGGRSQIANILTSDGFIIDASADDYPLYGSGPNGFWLEDSSGTVHVWGTATATYENVARIAATVTWPVQLPGIPVVTPSIDSLSIFNDSTPNSQDVHVKYSDLTATNGKITAHRVTNGTDFQPGDTATISFHAIARAAP